MKSQLDVCAVERANCCDTAMSSGTAPNTYHKKAVKPAHNAAELNSPSSGLQFTCRSYPNRYQIAARSTASTQELQGRFRPYLGHGPTAPARSAEPSDFRLFGHLITRSALAKTLGGIIDPICLAVFRLITNSNFMGRSTGRSAGLAPF